MSLSHRITGPLAALAAMALVICAWLFLQAPSGAETRREMDRRTLAVAAHLATVREAHRMGSRIALSGIGQPAAMLPPEAARPARKSGTRGGAGAPATSKTKTKTPAPATIAPFEGVSQATFPAGTAPAIIPAPGAAPRGQDGRALGLLHDAVATALAAGDAMRTLSYTLPVETAVERLDNELLRWRDDVENIALAETAGPGAPVPALEALWARDRLIGQLVGSVGERLARTRTALTEARRAASLRSAAFAVAAVLVVALCLGAVMLHFSRRLVRQMARLPGELQQVVGGELSGPLPSEARHDEMGVMVRELRAFGERMHMLTQSRAEMEKMALTDPLTGLPNRRGLYDFLATAAAKGGWGVGGTVAVIHIDLDHFKAINDTYGHDAGDNVLREATRRMSSVIRDCDILARLGGDEFVIVAQGVTGQGSLERLANRIVRQFDVPIAFRDRTLQVSVSLGAVLSGEHGEVPDPKRLLINADQALGQAKTAGRNRWTLFTAEMAHDARRQSELADEIRAGIERAEFRMWFRPVMDVRSATMKALDVVLRWHHPERGILRNDDFLDTAEANNLTSALVMPALDEALRQAAGWRATGARLPTLQIGMTRAMLLAPDIVDRLAIVLDEHGIEFRGIAIQISERFCSGRSFEAVFANLRRLAGLGAAIVIDEFGSVDAALGTVTRLGAGAIKFDVGRTKGLVARENGHPVSGADAQGLLTGIIGIGDSLGVEVLAKGVADHTARDSLRSRGFAYMQGEAIAPAMDAAAIGEMLARGAAPVPVRLAAG